MGPKKKGDSRGVPKPGSKQAKTIAEHATERVKGSQIATDEPRKPSAKEIIGGASWTGKLPVNMLSEHCQKQKWEKPEYTMAKTPEGYLSSVILKRVDPKSKDMTVLPPFHPPSSHKHLACLPTALEARHFAATYTLFRVCSMRNLHMMMPPSYRKLWKEDFTELKKTDCINDRAWMYEADPFLVKQERESAAADADKKKAEREKMRAKTSDNMDMRLGSSIDSKGHKAWLQAPKVDLGSKIRREVEDIIRHHAVWNQYGVVIPTGEQNAIIEEFSRLGFRRSHVKEAVAECKDRGEVLEWLLVYIPEDDLPHWCLPEGYSAGVSLATDDLVREAKVKRLASAGYATDFCEQALDCKQGNELAAAELLQNALIHGEEATVGSVHDGIDTWEEEQDTLEATFGEQYASLSAEACEIKSESSSLPESTVYRFQRPSGHYPSSPPVISIRSKISAHIRLSAIRQAVQYAEGSLLGESMIYSLFDWLEANLPAIIESPGKLRDISGIAAPSTMGTTPGPPVCQPRTQRKEVGRTPDYTKNISVRKAWESKQSTAAQQEMNRKRESLPAWDMQEAIIESVNAHQVTIISGETGSGKSTQSVQFLLDDMIKRNTGTLANIVCTQPRRISALGLADRVSAERCSPVGDEVGYIIRGDSKVKPGVTKITFVTTGVLLRRLQAGARSDGSVTGSLADITHVVVDEVHERSLDTDFLLALLKDILHSRKDIKVILMSATLDADIFINYFGGCESVGLVHIPGRTFPVEDHYLDDILRKTSFVPRLGDMIDENSESIIPRENSMSKILRNVGPGINYEVICSTVQYIDSQLQGQPGGILIFLPGTLEIDRCLTAVRKIRNVYPLPLHASLPPAEQRRVFLSPPKGKRKVVAATNVAETSITIDDIVAVIDTGRVKETSYDPGANMVRLQEVWASQAACKQRRGRAGRVRAGACYKLYTHNAELAMADRPEAEIRRVPLEQLCLSIKAMTGVDDVAAFLSNTITPPESVAVEGALDFLHRTGALDHNRLTALGRYLSMIPADLRCAKLMVYGAFFGCVDSCVTIAAILTVKSPFVSPREKREEAEAAKLRFSRGDGDLLTDLAAYQQWSARVNSQGYWQTQPWCNTHFLSHQTLREISSNRAQFLSSLKDMGILPIHYSEFDSSWNRDSVNRNLLRALIAGAFQPQIARISYPDKKFASSVTGTVEVDPDARTIRYFNQENGRVFIHPSSVLFSSQAYSGSASYLSYFNKIATSKVFIRDLTPFNAYSLLLFCGSISLDTMGRGLIVDGWLRLRGWARIGVLVSRLRMMLDESLTSRFENPSADISGLDNGAPDAGSGRLIEAVKKLVELNGLDQ